MHKLDRLDSFNRWAIRFDRKVVGWLAAGVVLAASWAWQLKGPAGVILGLALGLGQG